MYKGMFWWDFSTPKYIPQAKNKINHRVSLNLMVTCLKDISEDGFLFRGKWRSSLPAYRPLQNSILSKIKFI